MPRKRKRSHHLGVEKQFGWGVSMLDFPGLLGRGCISLPSAQTTQIAIHGFLLLQGAAALETGGGGPSTSTADLEPQESAFLLEVVLSDIGPPPPTLCHPQRRVQRTFDDTRSQGLQHWHVPVKVPRCLRWC